MQNTPVETIEHSFFCNITHPTQSEYVEILMVVLVITCTNYDTKSHTVLTKFCIWQGQIKLKESALERSSNSFLEKEKDLQNKIEELESRMEDLSQSSKNFWENQLQKVSNCVSVIYYWFSTNYESRVAIGGIVIT